MSRLPLLAALLLLFPPARLEAEVLGLYPDFASNGALVLGFGELIENHPQTLVAIVEALDDRFPIVGVVANDAQDRDVHALLEEARAPVENLVTVQVPVVGMWMRDYGPSFAKLPDGRVMTLDAVYGRSSHAPDEWVPRYLAGYFRLPIVDVPLRVAGGNLLANGEGWVVSTSQILEFNGKDGLSQADIGGVLAQYYGATDWMVLKPLLGEPTQHADMFVAFVAPDVAVVGQIDPAVDAENAKRLDDAASQLSGATTRSGPIRVVRVPMPGHEDGLFRSYTNVLFAGDTVLVPAYPDVSPEMDREALAVFRELLPDRRVLPIDASSIIRNNGSLHCISVNVPKLD